MKNQIGNSSKSCKILAILLSFLFLFQQTGFAQVAGQLDISGHLTSLRNAFAPDVFRPLHLRYLSYNPQENNFRLFLDKGSLKNPKSEELEGTTKQLLSYFFVGISLPNDKFWVNLRPDAEDNIIDGQLAQTDVGKILLESDLQLKKDTARFTSPETPEGKEYWAKLYQKAGEIFGSQNITIPTLTRPWIVPDEIIIRETTDSAYIYKATLKVMLEQDYLKDSAVYNFQDDRLKELNEYSSQLIREIIIPKLTQEINSSKRYASLRQVYYSLIMAQWFKARFTNKDGLYSRIIDKRIIYPALYSKESWSKNTYFKEYQKSFKDGEYNIQEPVYTLYGQTIRSYFSGGTDLNIKVMPRQFGGMPDNRADSNGIKVLLSPAPVELPDALATKDELKVVQVQGTENPGELSNIQIAENQAALPIVSGINLAAGTSQRVPHGSVNNYIRDNLPRDLRGNVNNIKNYRLVKGFDTEARAIPIKGLFQATGQFAHIGLGQAYGQPVIYIDSVLTGQEEQAVLNHELFEVARWETLREELGKQSNQMRQWIQDNYEFAKEQEEAYHSGAPSIEHLFAKYKSQVDRDSVEMLLAMYESEKDINLAAGKRSKDKVELPPAAISFQVVDLKWDGKNIKILEIQHGMGSAFDGYRNLYGTEIMDDLWDYLGGQGLSGLVVLPDLMMIMGGAKVQRQRGSKALERNKGVMTVGQGFNSAIRNPAYKQKKGFEPDNLGTYSGVMVLQSTLHSNEELDKIREQNPHLLELDSQGATYVFLGDKLLANSLFTGEIAGDRPKWRLISKSFDPIEVARQIRAEMPSRSGEYAIKAIDSSRGRGFIAVEDRDLEKVLTRLADQLDKGEIIRQREKLENLELPEGEDDPYQFWALDTSNPGLLIEELVHSKPVKVDGKNYDGTMRIAYVVTYDKTNGIQLKILGSYWKLPTTAIGGGEFTGYYSFANTPERCRSGSERGIGKSISRRSCCRCERIREGCPSVIGTNVIY